MALPAVLIGDTLAAALRGWDIAVAGPLGIIPLAAVAFLAVALLAFCVAPLRRAIGRSWAAWWSLNLSLVLALVGGEAWLRAGRPAASFHLRPPGAVYEFDADPRFLPGVFEVAHTTINRDGVRGPEMPSGVAAYRLLCLGGSTTECDYLDDRETWPARLAEHLSADGAHRVWAGSASLSPASTADHLRFLRESPLIAQVDAVLVLPGANDLYRTLLGLPTAVDVAGPWWFESRIVGLTREAWNVRGGHGLLLDRTGAGLQKMRHGRPIPPRAIDWDAEIAAYQARLAQLVAAARRRGVRLVLVTQPVMWDDFLSTLGAERLRWASLYPKPRPWEQLLPGALREVFDRYNQAVLRVGEETGVECIDAAAAMTAIEMYYYDDLHFNETGCEKMAEVLASQLTIPGPATPEGEPAPRP